MLRFVIVITLDFSLIFLVISPSVFFILCYLVTCQYVFFMRCFSLRLFLRERKHLFSEIFFEWVFFLNVVLYLNFNMPIGISISINETWMKKTTKEVELNAQREIKREKMTHWMWKKHTEVMRAYLCIRKSLICIVYQWTFFTPLLLMWNTV